MIRKLLWLLPVMAVLAILGALIGSIFGKALLGAAIGAFIPVVWVVMLVCFGIAFFGSLNKMLKG